MQSKVRPSKLELRRPSGLEALYAVFAVAAEQAVCAELDELIAGRQQADREHLEAAGEGWAAPTLLPPPPRVPNDLRPTTPPPGRDSGIWAHPRATHCGDPGCDACGDAFMPAWTAVTR